MKRTLRETAALFVEAGRALGHVDHCKALDAMLAEIVSESMDTDKPGEFDALLARLRELQRRTGIVRQASERAALAAQALAERQMAALERPGARLARRVLRAARAARVAWATAR
jgi:hypothetical protein